jgi:hypothetical protein
MFFYIFAALFLYCLLLITLYNLHLMYNSAYGVRLFSYCTFLVILSYFAGTVPFCLYCTCIRFLHLLLNTQLILYQSLCIIPFRMHCTLLLPLYPSVGSTYHSASTLYLCYTVSLCLYCTLLLILYLSSYIVPSAKMRSMYNTICTFTLYRCLLLILYRVQPYSICFYSI